LLATATTVAWFSAPSPALRHSGANLAEAWDLPKSPARESAKWIAAINQHKLWGVSMNNSQAGPSEEKGWGILGVVIHGDDAFALISVGGRPSEQYRVGDLTPDGAKILKIEEDRLHVLEAGKKSILEIYRK
jgi:hypothetical protein